MTQRSVLETPEAQNQELVTSQAAATLRRQSHPHKQHRVLLPRASKPLGECQHLSSQLLLNTSDFDLLHSYVVRRL